MKSKKKKQTKKNKKAESGYRGLKLWFFVLIWLAAAFASTVLLWVMTPKFRYFGFMWERKLEYGDEYEVKNGEVCFGTFIKCEWLDMESSGETDVKELGEHKVVYIARYGEREVMREITVTVVDETPPELELTEFENLKVGEEAKISVCPNGKIPRIKMSAKDRHDGDVTDRIEMQYSDEGLVIISVSDGSGNRAEKMVKGVIEDVTAPVISLNGTAMKTIVRGTLYDDEGATAEDNCDGTVEVVVDNKVDVNTAGDYTVDYKAKDEAGNEDKRTRIVKVINPENSNKVVYLTFDDGPGTYTGRLLDILKKYGVKATFFVTGGGDDALIKREYDEGHTVALHTNSHNYTYVYSSVENYFADLYAVRDRVQRITGYAPTLIRFPGGSSNTISAQYRRGIMSTLVREVESRGFQYADWNISSGDAGGASTADQVYNNVISRLGEGRYVVLQHDIKGFSVDAVERIIQYGQANGYVFLPMTSNSFLAHHGVNN